MIPLAILCAGLVAAIALQRRSLRVARERGAAIEAQTTAERVKARQGIERHARLIADAWDLMRDDKHRGKLDNFVAWRNAHDEWELRAVGMAALGDSLKGRNA